MRRSLTVIVFATLALSGAGVRGDTLAYLEQLLVLKERADRARAQQEAADWAAQGRAMIFLQDRADVATYQMYLADRAAEGRYMIFLQDRADVATYQMYLADRSREGRKLLHWDSWVIALSESPSDALWITPAGLLRREAMLAWESGNAEAAIPLVLKASELEQRANARRAAIEAKLTVNQEAP